MLSKPSTINCNKSMVENATVKCLETIFYIFLVKSMFNVYNSDKTLSIPLESTVSFYIYFNRLILPQSLPGSYFPSKNYHLSLLVKNSVTHLQLTSSFCKYHDKFNFRITVPFQILNLNHVTRLHSHEVGF